MFRNMSKEVNRQKSEREARRRSREIDSLLARTSQMPVTILLAGECQSGKSTFLKQMRIISGQEFSHTELLEFRKAIYENIIMGMQMLVNEKNKLGIPWQDSANEMHEMLVKPLVPWNMNLEPHTFQCYINAINSLWKDSAIQEAYSKNVMCDYMVALESVKYFLDNIDRISQLSYIPSYKDFLYAHKSQKATADYYFVFHNFLFMIFKRNSMRKLFRYYENTTIIFIVASSKYDQVLFEDNSLVQSLNLFKVIINNRFLCEHNIILFLNKTDLLAEKVQTADIRKNFPEFKGDPHSLEDVQIFLVQCFRQKMENDSRPLFHHFTTAVETENIRIAFDSVKDVIMQRNLKQVKFQ